MAAILGLSSHLPTTIRTIEDIIDLVNEQHGGEQHQYAPDGTKKRTLAPTRAAIMKYMGVEERRIVGPDEGNADLGARAARKALENAHYDGPLDGTLCATVATGTYPSVAARLHHLLGGKRDCFAVDLTSQPRPEAHDDALEVGYALRKLHGGNHLVMRPGRTTLLTERGAATLEQDGSATAKALLDHLHLPGAALDGIIHSQEGETVAARIEELLGLRTKRRIDLHAACAGFGYGLDIARALHATEPYLLVSSEVLSRETDYTDANSPLFGDGAGAALVGTGAGLELLASDYGLLSEHADLIYRDAEGWLRMPDGHSVFKHAVREMSDAVQRVTERAGWSIDDVNLLVAHQANIRILNQVGQRTGIPPENIVITINRYGNMSAPTCPVAMHDAMLDGRLHEGSKVVQVAFGSGLVYSATALEATRDMLRE